MKHGRGIAALLLLSLLFAPTAFAQFEIEVKSVETAAFPEITADVVVRQNGVILRDRDSSDFVLREDGFLQSPLHLTHPMPTQSFSLAILIGVGSTMSSGDIGFAAGVASRLVDRMDGIVDEGAVITYDHNIITRQAMTHIKPLLNNALGSVAPTGGGNYIWEGGYKALNYVLGNATHPSRTLIIFSNGKGDGGANDVQQVINLAKTNNVKVHCFGVGAVGNDQDMRLLCQETGGTYYSSADLLVQELIDELNGTPEASQLTYVSDNLCRDGEDRSLFVQVKRNNDSTGTTFTAALAADPSGDITVDLAPDTSTLVSGGTAGVALLLTPAVTDQRLYNTTIPMTFDTSLIQIEAVETEGQLAGGMSAAFAMTESGAEITLTGAVKIDGGGALLNMILRGGIVQTNTSARMEV
ncbi:MAG: VWA domain-containing protein, partial [Bacteroidetes bacterium]|nr:VWA domain-containing protein [Bacteroidota bacterium]